MRSSNSFNTTLLHPRIGAVGATSPSHIETSLTANFASSRATSLAKRIPWLDGLRGSLSLWVYLGHLSLAVGTTPPILGNPGLAVDMFMLLSGFLMTWHWPQADGPPRLDWCEVRRFWIRRFFRIAPLYYLLLPLSFGLTPLLLSARHYVSYFYPSPWTPVHGDYVSPLDHTISAGNILAHISFAFGAMPAFCSNNALPDWSISIEMQFYAVFPFLLFTVRPASRLSVCAIVIAIALLMRSLFGLYCAPGPLGTFPYPSFLPFKLHLFTAGILLALAVKADATDSSRSSYLTLAILPLVFCHKVVLLIAIVCILLLTGHERYLQPVKTVLQSTPFRRLGDLSYALYLVHLLPVYLGVQWLLEHTEFALLGGAWRVVLASTLLTPPIILLSALLHYFVERPGIALGKQLMPETSLSALSAPSTRSQSKRQVGNSC